MNRKRTSQRPINIAWDEVLAWPARVLLLMLLLASPWPYAMAQWNAQLWLLPALLPVLAISAIIAIARGYRILNPVALAWVGLILLGLLQIAPLPDGLWNWLSPTATFLAETSSVTDSGDDRLLYAAGSTVSVHAEHTRATLCVLSLALSAFISSQVLFRSDRSRTLLLGTISLSGLFVAALGIYQAIVAGDWRLLDGIKINSFATFVSRNSAPQFLACAIGASAALLLLYQRHRSGGLDSRYKLKYPSVNPVAKIRRRIDDFVSDIDPLMIVGLLALVLLVIAVFTANSRGGILACIAAGVVTAMAQLSTGQSKYTSLLVVGLLGVGTVLFLSAFELDQAVGARIGTLSEEAYRRDNVRFSLWQMALSQPHVWLLGSGLGTFHFAILAAYPTPQTTWYYHAENVYVEVLSGGGSLAAGCLLLALLWLVGRTVTRQPKHTPEKAMRLACLFPLIAISLQSFVDFSLFLPAVFLPLAALTGTYLASADAASTSRGRSSRRSSRSGRSDRHQSHRRSSSSSRGRSSSRSGDSRSESSRDAGRIAGTSEHRPSGASAVGAPTLLSPSAHRICTAVILAIILTGTIQGASALRGFAVAESLEQALQRAVAADRQAEEQPSADSADDQSQEEIASQVLAVLDAERVAAEWPAHPEVRLQLGRLQQARSEALLREAAWPEGVNERMQQVMARPEFVSAAFLASEDQSDMLLLKDFVSQQTDAVRWLGASSPEMRTAASYCPLDWRAGWGLLRSDRSDLTEAERRVNYRRLQRTARNNFRTMQATATHALMVGNQEVALDCWQELLEVSSIARNAISRMVGPYMTLEQLIGILPDDAYLKIEMANRFARAGRDEDAAELLTAVDLQAAFRPENRKPQWLLIAWAAEQQGNTDMLLQTLREASLDDPADHKLSYRLAEAYSAAGQPAEALKAVERALLRSSKDPIYIALRDQLQAQLATP